jgi:hypothetical protein
MGVSERATDADVVTRTSRLRREVVSFRPIAAGVVIDER